jgi:hypothetical protein
MMKDISTVKMLAKLKKEVKAAGGTVKAANKWGVLAQNLSAAMSGTALPPPDVLRVLKLKPVKQIKYRYEVL